MSHSPTFIYLYLKTHGEIVWDIKRVLYLSHYNFIRNIFYPDKYLESLAEFPHRKAFRFSCEVSFIIVKF